MGVRAAAAACDGAVGGCRPVTRVIDCEMAGCSGAMLYVAGCGLVRHGVRLRSRAEGGRICTRARAPLGEEKDGVMGKRTRRKLTELGVS